MALSFKAAFTAAASETFFYDESTGWITVDASYSLADWCEANNCCKNDAGEVSITIACNNVGENLSFTISSGSCLGDRSCSNIGRIASGGSVTINENSCVAIQACNSIGSAITGNLDVVIGAGACASSSSDDLNLCLNVGYDAQSITNIEDSI